MQLAGPWQDTAVRSLLSCPLIAGVARTRQRLPFQRSARVLAGNSGLDLGKVLPAAMQLAGRGQEIEVRTPVPPGMGVVSTCHAVPVQRAVSGRSRPLPALSSPTAMQLLPLVHQTPVNSATCPPGSGLGWTVQAVPSQVAVRVWGRLRLR